MPPPTPSTTSSPPSAASTRAPASSTWPSSADSMLSDGADRDHVGRFLCALTRSDTSAAPTPPSPRDPGASPPSFLPHQRAPDCHSDTR
ncbi:peroxisomal membrane protein 2 [Iris pallida]|uniref:Peroxisomal membrane protein 2 n=1 Tax=Iris pallida TaxID=29817 RepID=A0AAX6HI21_IRIPA|nr:peroxisomal membrane protein 2 [Iris pallida]